MNRFFLFSIAVFAISLGGCRKTYKFDNGEVPDEFLTQAKNAFAGEYQGYFEDDPLELQISFNDNVPVLNFSRDIIGPDCQSKVGKIESAEVEKNKEQVTVHSVSFSIESDLCPVRGQHISLRPYSRSGRRFLELKILFKTRRECKLVGDHYVCDRVDYYLTGEVADKNI